MLCKCNSFHFKTDLLNSENLQVANTQLCNELQSKTSLCYSWLQNRWITYETIYSKCNSFQVISDLFNSYNLKVAFNQLCHELQACNFTLL